MAPTLVVAELTHDFLRAQLEDARVPHGGRVDYVHAGCAETGLDAADVVFGPHGGITLSERCWTNHVWHTVRAPRQTRWKCLVLPPPRG